MGGALTLLIDLQCPCCSRVTRFSSLTEFWDHVMRRHADRVSAEEDAQTVTNLDTGLERRKQRDKDVSQVKDKLAS